MELIINSYTLPESFIWDRGVAFEFNYKSYLSEDLKYVLNENSKMIQISGKLIGSSKSDVEDKLKILINNVMEALPPLEMTYAGRTYFVYPICYVKTEYPLYPEILKVTLVYNLKKGKEDEW